MDKTTPTIGPGSAGHLHLCPKDHYWQHAVATAEGCALPTFIPCTGLQPAAQCAGRDDLLTRPPHSHRCGFCEVEMDPLTSRHARPLGTANLIG
jgi:hypothetical protein